MIYNKKGISGVLTTIILIAIVVVLAGMVFSVIVPMIRENIKHSNACSTNIIGKINLNKLDTCYEEIIENEIVTQKIMKVSVEIGDLKYDKILIYISKAGNSKTKEIKDQAQNSGKTYKYNVINDLEFDGKPDTIKLVPVIDGQQCDVIDSINNVQICA